MDVKPFLGLLILALFFSYILSSTAIPTSRSLISIKKDSSTTNSLPQGGGIGVKNDDGKLIEKVEGSSGKEKMKMEMVSTEHYNTVRDQTSSSMEMMIKNNNNNENEMMKKKGRVDIFDYNPPGANPRHNPHPPPSA